ncbi:hypothetical protein [Paraflavitalea speifideaquila]|uniref:hypothetical protein n=1 Tax=Paraflavitalea speifideaquila TaxID=3076558 RepID=UPI0028ED47AE|nr:hypothetical protein [Paraflavitalea speifideiaquila]
MPQLPKWLADSMLYVANPWLRHAVVSNTTMITGELKMVTFKGEFDHENFYREKLSNSGWMIPISGITRSPPSISSRDFALFFLPAWQGAR